MRAVEGLFCDYNQWEQWAAERLWLKILLTVFRQTFNTEQT